MNNIGIILNQDNNQSYLGKFYNRNTLEFPVIRKIYEQIELNKTNATNNPIIIEKINNGNLETKNIDNMPIASPELANITHNDNIDEIEVESINNTLNINSNEIIILDNTENIYAKNKNELDFDPSEIDQSKKIPNNIDTSNIQNISDNDIIVSDNKDALQSSQIFQVKYNFSTNELVFLWLSSLLLMVSLELNVFKNFFS
jgi:hypothetical protein